MICCFKFSSNEPNNMGGVNKRNHMSQRAYKRRHLSVFIWFYVGCVFVSSKLYSDNRYCGGFARFYTNFVLFQVWCWLHNVLDNIFDNTGYSFVHVSEVRQLCHHWITSLLIPVLATISAVVWVFVVAVFANINLLHSERFNNRFIAYCLRYAIHLPMKNHT